MAISAQGVGSGLDVNSIVSQLVALEKQSLKPLQDKATTLQSQLSLYGTVKSQASTLGDAAAKLATASTWSSQKSSSSDADAVAVTTSSTATSQSLSVEVLQLAQSQSAASSGVATGDAVGYAGTLTFQLGSWAGNPNALAFTSDGSASVDVSVDADDTMADIASKINAAGAGVKATVLRDGADDRLVLRSATTGASGGFSVTTAGDAGLSMFALTGVVDSTDSTPVSGMFMSQVAQDAEVKINGVEISADSNTLSNVVTGVTLKLKEVTASPVTVTIESDTEGISKAIQALADAYNALNKSLVDATKYDATSKKGGILQGDAVTVGLQNSLRSMLGSSSVGSTYARLSEIGLERQVDGSLKVDTSKLNDAIENLDNLKALFMTNNNDVATNGFGIKIRDFARGLVAADGRVSSKTTALKSSIDRNTDEQDRVNARAARVEADLRRQYTTLDTKMAQMGGLTSFVNAQLAQWNKSSS